MIDAAHAVASTIMIAYNDRDPVPANADLYIHLSPKVSSKPWLESEATPTNAPGGYWSTYSKRDQCKSGGIFYNFSRIGRYTPEMKGNQYDQTRERENYNGYMLASTWLQCGPGEAVNGPFMTPGGRSNIEDLNTGLIVCIAIPASFGGWSTSEAGTERGIRPHLSRGELTCRSLTIRQDLIHSVTVNTMALGSSE